MMLKSPAAWAWPASDVVHVWRAKSSGECALDWEVLDALERRRAERLVQPLHRRRFVAAHGFLRHLLAAYLGCAPRALRFATGATGKPWVVEPAVPHCGFNLSHSGDLAVVAIARDQRIGIDIECADPMADMERLVMRFFAASEAQGWRALASAQRTAGFFRLWTRKEAFMKATGAGLALGLDQVVVSCEESAQLLQIPAQYGLPGGWTLHDFTAAPGVFGAVVVAGAEVRAELYDWPVTWADVAAR